LSSGGAPIFVIDDQIFVDNLQKGSGLVLGAPDGDVRSGGA
jgi:hypothetical protein